MSDTHSSPDPKIAKSHEPATETAKKSFIDSAMKYAVPAVLDIGTAAASMVIFKAITGKRAPAEAMAHLTEVDQLRKQGKHAEATSKFWDVVRPHLTNFSQADELDMMEDCFRAVHLDKISLKELDDFNQWRNSLDPRIKTKLRATLSLSQDPDLRTRTLVQLVKMSDTERLNQIEADGITDKNILNHLGDYAKEGLNTLKKSNDDLADQILRGSTITRPTGWKRFFRRKA